MKKIHHSLLYGYKANETSYIDFLREKGVSIGTHTHFYSPWTIKVDIQRPWMIQIGNHVHIAADCSILQHGYDWAVFQHLYGDVLGSCGTVKIGTNVFIGQRTLILKGADIGDNVIIGAGSLVCGPLPSNGVYAGTPARLLMSLNDYYEKRKKRQFVEARMLVISYREKYGENPPKEHLREFFWLFEPRESTIDPVFKKVHRLDGNEALSQGKFEETQPMFDGYESFLKNC